MTLTIKKQLSPTRPMVNGYGYGNKKKFLTIHQTGNTNKGANAQMHANLQSRVYGASWHWQVDDKEAIQSFEHTYRCWHASDGRGDGNSNSIGIEGCINSDGNYVKSVENMAELAAKILKDEGIPIENMRQHHDFDTKNRKNCPAQIRAGKDGINWNKFVQMVKDNMKGTVVREPVKTPVAVKPVEVKPVAKPVAPKPQPTGNGVVKAIQKTVGVKEDGWDGPNTRKGVVKLFQRYFGANADGYVGNETLNKAKVIRSGDKGWHVYAVQAMLYLKGYTSVGTPDQIAGPKFVQAVKNFQKDNGLGVDGTPGKQTYAKLLRL